NNPDAAVREIDRAIDDLQATGVQIYTNVAGRPLDSPEYQPIFDRMAQRDLPIWMHPARPAAFADYAGEKRSKFDMWWAFGWPYETSVAMGRLVFSGIFDRHPGLKIITHHLGAMVPFCAGRVGGGLDQLGSRSDDPEDTSASERRKHGRCVPGAPRRPRRRVFLRELRDGFRAADRRLRAPPGPGPAGAAAHDDPPRGAGGRHGPRLRAAHRSASSRHGPRHR